MTENKRFSVHITWFNYEKSEGEIELMDNGQPLLLSECVEDVQGVKRLLNELNDENEQLKSKIKDFQDILSKNDNVCYERVLRLIDEKIKFVEKCNEMYKTNTDYYRGAIEILELLKKELSE